MEYDELYEEIYGITLSNDESRKRLSGIKDHISIKLDKENNENTFEHKNSLEINADGSQDSNKVLEIIDNEKLKDEGFLLKAHGYNPQNWKIINARSTYYNMQKKGGKITTLYYSRISVKPEEEKFNPDWIKEVVSNLNIDKPKIKRKNYNSEGITLEINLADVHINKLATIDETRNEYSTDIALQKVWQVIEDTIEKTKYYKIKKIIFPFGQDVANIDNIFNSTTKGTPQDTDVKYDVMYKKILKTFIEIIYRLTEIAPVEVIYVGGNHDKITSFTMAEAMYWHFINNENVDVDSVFNVRKYRLIGNTLLGFAHGADEKKNIIYTMQNDVPELWGKSKYREFHLSHFHKEMMVDEKNGIIMRWVSAISGTDAWTHNSGYVGSQKKAQSFIWNDEYGLEAIINSYV